MVSGWGWCGSDFVVGGVGEDWEERGGELFYGVWLGGGSNLKKGRRYCCIWIRRGGGGNMKKGRGCGCLWMRRGGGEETGGGGGVVGVDIHVYIRIYISIYYYIVFVHGYKCNTYVALLVCISVYV